MALETVVFQQDPFSYGYNKDFYSYGFEFEEDREQGLVGFWELSAAPAYSLRQIVPELESKPSSPAPAPPTDMGSSSRGRKRRRTKSLKNMQDMENQRITHIAVERNRRKLMNDYLAIIRSLMPPSYAQRGDQASIVGGAINFVKELEQLLQFLEAHKQGRHRPSYSPLFSKFFSFPQYSTRSRTSHHMSPMAGDDLMMGEKQSSIADIQVNMVETHANIKVLSKRQPKQLLKMAIGFQNLGLTILHLNVTTAHHLVLYSFSVKVEDHCQLSTLNEIATSVHEMMGKIRQEAASSI
ncbi:hypothetical protein NMG60_11016963 [Bertholletia excelsa]